MFAVIDTVSSTRVNLIQVVNGINGASRYFSVGELLKLANRMRLNTYDRMEFPKKLAMLMERSRLSQQALANRVGLQQSRISKWTTGKGEPSLKQAVELARVLDVPLEYLADDAIDEPPPAPSKAQMIVMQLIEDMGYDEARRRLAQVIEVELIGRPAPGSPDDPAKSKPRIKGAG